MNDSSSAGSAVEASSDGSQARSDDATFALTDFLRLNKGTSKAYNNLSYGYRFSMAGDSAFAVVITKTAVIVYLPAETVRNLSIKVDDPAAQRTFLKLVGALDRKMSSGGILLANQTTPLLFTAEKEVTHDGYTYSFAVEIAPDQYYVCITSASDAENDSDGALYVNTGLLVPASDVVIDRPPEGFDAVWKFFGGIDYRPFWVSMRTSLVAMLFVFILGLA
ncbi:MAG: hypothetical protein LBH87_00515, partial [Coriobacteriales bacterium]|nr:hypothetical protein [Coriobacteriales bacterium]